MLILPLKATVRCELHMQLAKWLDDKSSKEGVYNRTAPPKPSFTSVDCRSDLIRLASIRNCLADCLSKSDSHKVAIDESAVRDLHEYYAALLAFERMGFPLILTEEEESSSASEIRLAWYGAFANQQQEIHSSFVWDRIGTLWNIVALETYLCNDQEKKISSNNNSSETSKETVKDAYKTCIQHCQNAASILVILKELVESSSSPLNNNNYESSSSNMDYATVDVSKPMLNFWETLLLAQAQIFVYRMVSSDNDTNTKHGMLSYLIAAAVPLFNDALQYAKDPRLQSEVPKQSDIWCKYCKANSMICSAKAEYHQSVIHRLNKEWGPEIGRLNLSLVKLKALLDFIDPLLLVTKNNKQKEESNKNIILIDIKKEVDLLYEFINDRKVRAERDNIQIYQDKIPNSLPDIPPKLMAKSNLGLPPAMLTTTVPLFVNLK